MKRPHVMHEAEILGEFEALLDPLRDLPQARILVDANDVCLPMCMRGPVPLVLVAAFEGRHSSENAARGTHVTAEEVLATPATVGGIAPRALRAHPRTEQPCQAQAHVQPMRLYHCERIARCGHPPEIILWQVDEDVLRLVASLAAGRTTFERKRIRQLTNLSYTLNPPPQSLQAEVPGKFTLKNVQSYFMIVHIYILRLFQFAFYAFF